MPCDQATTHTCATPAGFMPLVDPTTGVGTEEGNSLSAQPACNLGWDHSRLQERRAQERTPNMACMHCGSIGAACMHPTRLDLWRIIQLPPATITRTTLLDEPPPPPSSCTTATKLLPPPLSAPTMEESPPPMATIVPCRNCHHRCTLSRRSWSTYTMKLMYMLVTQPSGMQGR
jgi:hypothetical protein